MGAGLKVVFSGGLWHARFFLPGGAVSKTDIQILSSSIEHLGSFQRCLDSVARERLYLLMTEGPSEERLQNFILKMHEAGNPQVLALQNDEVVGWCDIRRLENRALSHAGGLGMGVKKEARGQGIGGRLLQVCLQHAWASLFRKVELTVFVHNTAAIELYRRQGFVQEGLLKEFAIIDGKVFDAYRMACFCPGDLVKEMSPVLEPQPKKENA